MLTDALIDALDKEGIALEEFRELCLRLLNNGVLSRDESLIEQQMYDRFVRIEPIIVEYLQIMGIRILHERKFSFLRVYPPGSQIPGIDDAGGDAFGGGLRARLKQDEVALILVLRLQYDKALTEGQLDDAGYVNESIESLGIAMKNLLGRSLPDKITDRKRIFSRLRQLRLIEYGQDDNMESAESWMKIHPMIVTFVTEESLHVLEQNLEDSLSDSLNGSSNDTQEEVKDVS